MTTVDGEETCTVCGKEFMYSFDCTTTEYTEALALLKIYAKKN